jgi:hypothetical protein
MPAIGRLLAQQIALSCGFQPQCRTLWFMPKSSEISAIYLMHIINAVTSSHVF